MTKGYVQIVEGAWYEPKRKGFIDQCCSCGLTHVTDFAVVDKDGNEVTVGQLTPDQTSKLIAAGG